MKTEKGCSTCKHSLEMYPDTEPSHLCRYYPPQLFNTGKKIVSAQPLLEANDYCSKWEAKR